MPKDTALNGQAVSFDLRSDIVANKLKAIGIIIGILFFLGLGIQSSITMPDYAKVYVNWATCPDKRKKLTFNNSWRSKKNEI